MCVWSIKIPSRVQRLKSQQTDSACGDEECYVLNGFLRQIPDFSISIPSGGLGTMKHVAASQTSGPQNLNFLNPVRCTWVVNPGASCFQHTSLNAEISKLSMPHDLRHVLKLQRSRTYHLSNHSFPIIHLFITAHLLITQMERGYN